MMLRRPVRRSRSRTEAAEPPVADDDPYALYLRWVEAGRPSMDDSEQGAGAALRGDPDMLAIDEEALDEPADGTSAGVRATATPSSGHVNALGSSTGAVASIRRRFRLFGRR
ncbi:hypothetical protein LQ757_02670 [Agromyces sp. SYSU K20354]|uniref:hypothetical protein n=1 Tax=Agromyces cavernae TaxID=2898659 RepID=UPI001E5F7E24|nr:hypothetical protein [Agromyces cavernae]MCD2441172.1 hypothetical protein [Agromyces cavernae]